jgi:hypothetical protein
MPFGEATMAAGCVAGGTGIVAGAVFMFPSGIGIVVGSVVGGDAV